MATTEGAAGPRRRSKHDGELRVDGDDGLPGVFSARELAAGLALDLAEPREVAAQVTVGWRSNMEYCSVGEAKQTFGRAERKGGNGLNSAQD